MRSPYQQAITKGFWQGDNLSADIRMALSEASEHIAHYARSADIEKIDLVILGGVALHLSGLRDNPNDVDLMIDTIELSTRMEQQLFRCKVSGLDVELFYDNKLGQLHDPFMFKRSTPVVTSQHHGVEVTVRSYPPEYFLLMKIDQPRDNSINDIRNLIQGIALPRIAEAFNEMIKHNEMWLMEEIADHIVTDIIMLSLPGAVQGDRIIGVSDFVKSLKITNEKQGDLLDMVSHIEPAKPMKKAHHACDFAF